MPASAIPPGVLPHRKLWGELARVGSLEAQAAARTQLGELEPSIRYASYRLGRTDDSGATDMVPGSDSDALGVRRRYLPVS